MRYLGLLVAALLLLGAPTANAQTSPRKYLSAATTNSTLVRSAKGSLGQVVVFNSTATIYYLKLYDKATAPTCGTDVPKWTVMVPANGQFSMDVGSLMFYTGIGFCLTSGFADNDTGAAATGVIINLGASGSP